MTDHDIDPETEEQIRTVVREELESAENEIYQHIPVTRRDVLAGAALLGSAAIGMGIRDIGIVGRAAAQSGQGQIGTSNDPLSAIYVQQLYQEDSYIEATTLHVNSNQVYVQKSEPSSPSTGDIWISDS